MEASRHTLGPVSPRAPSTVAEELRLSHYQEKIIEFVVAGKGHGVVQATAGAGKTSTLVQVAARLEPHRRACFLAFGRDAANELGRRLPSFVVAMTVHKLGRQTLEEALRRRGLDLAPVERWKYRRLLREELKEFRLGNDLEEPQVAEGEEYLSRLLDLARLNLCDPGDDEGLRNLALRYTIVPPGSEVEPLLHEVLRRVLVRGSEEALRAGTSDFTDMLYLPVTQELEPPRFDFVCVDEAQDYSALALAFTTRLVAEGGRLLFVGDPRQSIYGFAGADSEAMERISRETEATILPLSITYRCPRSHVALARLLAPEIEAGPEATEGRVFWVADRLLEHWAREGDMILCRANAPLVSTCLRLIRAGRRAFVRGRDLRRQLLELSRRALAEGAADVRERIDEFTEREEARLRRALEGSAFEQAVLAERQDLLGCLRFLAADLEAGVPATLALPRRIEDTFAESDGALILSTIHRAKGQEADRVLLLYPELMPAPYARTSQALRGEASVQFVALTRARCDLVFVTDSLTPAYRGSTGDSTATGVPTTDAATRLRSRSTGAQTLGELSYDDRIGQGPGVWKEVLALARVLARGRG